MRMRTHVGFPCIFQIDPPREKSCFEIILIEWLIYDHTSRRSVETQYGSAFKAMPEISARHRYSRIYRLITEKLGRILRERLVDP